jgi:hypothetical protein
MSVAREEANGSTMRSTGEMPLMGIGKRRISLAERPAARVAGSRVLGLELAPVVAPELERGLAAVLVLVRVERVLGLGQVEVALELVQVEVAELVLGPVVALPVLGHPRAQLAVALRTRSVIALHRRGLPPLAVED